VQSLRASEPDIVVPIRRLVVVPVRGSQVLRMIVPRPPTEHSHRQPVPFRPENPPAELFHAIVKPVFLVQRVSAHRYRHAGHTPASSPMIAATRLQIKPLAQLAMTRTAHVVLLMGWGSSRNNASSDGGHTRQRPMARLDNKDMAIRGTDTVGHGHDTRLMFAPRLHPRPGRLPAADADLNQILASRSRPGPRARSIFYSTLDSRASLSIMT
jgi:hypothetical protein